MSSIPTPNGQRQITGLYPNNYSFDGRNLHLVDLYQHLDLADFLPSSTLAAIRSRAYVDFAKLLPDNVDDPLADDQNKDIAEVGGIKIQAKTKGTKNNAIDGVIKWTRAFCVWAFVFLDTNPTEAKGLFQYLHHILDGDKRFLWSSVYRYDKEVRLSMEKDLLRRIGPIDLRKWQHVVSYIKTKPHVPMSQLMSKRTEFKDQRSPLAYSPMNYYDQPKREFQQKKRLPTCNDFNRGKCNREKCKFAHACRRCRSINHGMHQCKVFWRQSDGISLK